MTTKLKLTCEKCGKFAGFIGDDGTGPLHEECLRDKADPECPIVRLCLRYLPPCRPTTPGNPHDRREDLAGIQTHVSYQEDRLE